MTQHVIECPQCDGNGWQPPASRMGQIRECHACNGEGWRAMTDDELAASAEAAEQEMFCGEPPVCGDERHSAAFQQKQDLRS